MMFFACQPGECASTTDMKIRVIEAKLATKPAEQADIETANQAIAANPKDAFTRVAAGEILASLGLLELAHEQFDEAEKLKPKFTLAMFEYYMRQNDRRLKLIYPYVEQKHPDAPAVMYKEAVIWSENSLKKKEAIAKMKAAADVDKPWPGARGRYGMLEYNRGNLDSAIKYCDAELKEHPHDLMAQKVRIMALLRKGKRPTDLRYEIRNALDQSRDDEQLNLLLSRAMIYSGKDRDAVWIALRGLLNASTPSSLGEGRNQVLDLLAKVGPRMIVDVTDTLCANLPQSDFRGTLFRMRVGELLAFAGHSKEAQYELGMALQMNPFFKETISYKLGREQLKQKNYYGAGKFFHLATEGDPKEAKYRQALDRTNRQLMNFKRDYALQLKILLSPFLVR
jgi:tetratricopeptide (TPR) repeat protein